MGVALVLLACSEAVSSSLEIQWVAIGNPGNAPDPETERGSVGYTYEISATEITNAQFVEYLNETDPLANNHANRFVRTYPRSLPGITFSPRILPGVEYVPQNSPGSKYTIKQGQENHPATVIWSAAARYANWLHNGKGSGDTEDGAYSLAGGGGYLDFYVGVERNPGSRVAIPTMDEWYKAAFHDAGAGTSGLYFEYPTSSNSAPSAASPFIDPSGSNYQGVVGGFTDVGAYYLASSPYGTYDQAGNAFEWLETYWGYNANAGLRASVGGNL
ncbi:Formylglycine-generating sulfatase enzyme [Pseudobythopirellula maris]|uniref:Formylglycine-generating sulfatase enzyme n=1 Tax=Pseudobythopirellula maris TaxID=2527991 RepID=A0A5C5ZN87_9BACT|nr:SUMF1/EgtB/PvdO family nonheme iron enzyme [Pseudobythopirellula maris]TWT88535.1 Formylglycine-generating sulfatase enzyme [Pseudobythopirellula maris]